FRLLLFLQRLFDRLYRLGHLLFLIVEKRQLESRVGVIIALLRNALEFLQRTVHRLHLGIGTAEIVAHAVVVGVGREDEVELRRGALKVAALEIDETDLSARLARISLVAL